MKVSEYTTVKLQVNSVKWVMTHVKSPKKSENLNPTIFDFDETLCTC